MASDRSQHPVDNPIYYMAIWNGLFAQLLGWSEEQVAKWAERFSAYLGDTDDMLFHANPIYWTTTALIPEWFNERLKPGERVNLKNRLLAAFQDEHGFEFPIDTDWEPFRVKLNQVLGEYGASLPVHAS